MLSILFVYHSLVSSARGPSPLLHEHSQQVLLPENMRPVDREDTAPPETQDDVTRASVKEEMPCEAEARPQTPPTPVEQSPEAEVGEASETEEDLNDEAEGDVPRAEETEEGGAPRGSAGECRLESARERVESDTPDGMYDKLTICDACETRHHPSRECTSAADCVRASRSHVDSGTRETPLEPPEEPEISSRLPAPRGRLMRQGQGPTPGQQWSATLNRPSRRGRCVPTPVDPRGVRSQTEPPANKPPPDLLQVSWVWETRQSPRVASVRRRPTRKISCRRKIRPRLTIRKATSRRSSISPQHRASPAKDEDETWAECEEEEGGEAPAEVAERRSPIAPDVLLTGTHAAPGLILASTPQPNRDGIAEEAGPPPGPPPEVALRNTRNLNYFQTASRAVKQRWRNSDIVLPKLLRESWANEKPEKGNKKKKRTLFERARNIPVHIRKISHLLVQSVKPSENSDLYGSEKENDIIYLDLRRQLRDSLQRQRSVRRRSVPAVVGVKRQGSFSPRNSLGRNKAVTWNQKYQAVMGLKRAGGGPGRGGADCPVIQVTKAAEGAATPASEGEGEGDWRSLCSTPTSSPHHALLGLDLPQKKPNVLKKLWGRLRHSVPRSLSPSRSRCSSRSSMSGGSEDGHSPSHSSDYEDQDEVERSGSASLVGRMRGLRRDMQKKISRLKSPRGSTSSSPGPAGVSADKAGATLTAPLQPSASSYESIPSSAPLGKVYQMTFASPAAATASGSNRSSLSGEEAEPYTGPFIGRARALVDCQPSPYDRDALKFKKDDIIDIIAKNPSGLWKGCVDGRVGHFKFILVEEEVERPARRHRPWRGTTPRRGRARTLEELLTRLNLGHLIQVFVLNGYEDLEQFRDVEKADLDCLGITDPETCAKLLTAVALLHDADSEPEPDLPEMLETTDAALRRGDHGRDSGCYTDHRSAHSAVLDENNLDTRQSTPSTDTSSGYHSRGPYNIPLGEATLTSREEALSSALDSPPSESTTSGATSSQPLTQSEPHSYRAHLATVLPASPRAKVRHGQQEDQKQRPDPQVDYEAKYNSARNVFEKEVVRREVPYTVRSPKRSAGTSQSPPSDSEEGTAAAPEEPSP